MPTASLFDFSYQLITFIDSLLSIVFTSIGLYLIIIKRKSITRLLSLLTNVSLQNTIKELEGKLDRLNEYSGNDNDTVVRRNIECLIHDINGQIEGNELLKTNFSDEQRWLQHYIEDPESLTEPLKRGLVSMLREKLKTLSLKVYSDIARGDNE